MTLRRLLLVFAGGVLGTAARLAFGLLIPDAGGFPLATLSVNILGALLIGVLAARLTGPTGLRIFLGTGVLGGFTTYSALAVGTARLWTDAPLIAAAYVLASLILGVTAAAVGVHLGKRRPR